MPYQVNVKALRRWAQERLKLEVRDDGSVDAAFRYEGTTCTNMGRPLTFDYRVRLGRRDEGYPIREQSCTPAPGDSGHTFMCRYIDDRENLMAAIANEQPLAGRPLHEVLTWTRPPFAAGCYCEPEAREHKWACAETIQYALDERTIADVIKSRSVKRWRDGYAVDVRRTRTRKLRRGMEFDASRARARHSRRYAEAGSDCILTNITWRLAHRAQPRQQRQRRRSIAPVSRRAQAFGGRRIVIGDIGPFGGLMEPYGDFTPKTRSAFEEQAKALVDAGADAILIETQTSLEELLIGIQAARAAGAACVIGSMAYDVTLDGSTFRTMMGIDPERAATFMEEHEADIVALNCGTGMDMERARQAVLRYRKVTDLPVMVQPNAGVPKLVQMKVVYDETPEQMAVGVAPLLEAGANLIGACCGSTPEHIRAFREELSKYENQALRHQHERA